MNNDSYVPQQPIGYWINRCDQAITNAMNHRLSAYDVNRIDWQVLNVIVKQKATTEAALFDQLQANADRDTLLAAVDKLHQRGYLRRTEDSPDSLALTEQGNRFWQTLGERIATFRDDSLRGITEEEYKTALFVLKRMTQNLALS